MTTVGCLAVLDQSLYLYLSLPESHLHCQDLPETLQSSAEGIDLLPTQSNPLGNVTYGHRAGDITSVTLNPGLLYVVKVLLPLIPVGFDPVRSDGSIMLLLLGNMQHGGKD